MPKGQIRSYRGLLGTPIFRPELWEAMVLWNNDTNKYLLKQPQLLVKMLQAYTKKIEDEHLQQMAIALGVVKTRGGIMPSYVWHNGWERDLTIALASEVFPEFSRVPPQKRGAKKGSNKEQGEDVKLANAIWDLCSRQKMSVNSACTHLSKKTVAPNKKTAGAIKAKFDRFMKSLKLSNSLQTNFEPVTEFARSWLVAVERH